MQNQNQNLAPQKTLGSVAGQKLLATLEKTSAAKLLIFGFAAYTLAKPESAFALIGSMLSAKSYFLVKLIVIAGLLNKWKWLLGISRRLIRYARTRATRGGNAEMLEGVPTYEILHQLFYGGSFKREEVIRKWGIPQSRFEMIAKKLEALGILIRGENNSRILNPEFTRAEVAEILKESGGSAEGIRNSLRIFDFGKSKTPSAAEMKESVVVAIEADENNDGEIPIYHSPLGGQRDEGRNAEIA